MPAHCITIALGLSQMRVIGERETEQEIRVELVYLARTAICPSVGRRHLRCTASVLSIGGTGRYGTSRSSWWGESAASVA